jgi:hypothetical protein
LDLISRGDIKMPSIGSLTLGNEIRNPVSERAPQLNARVPQKDFTRDAFVKILAKTLPGQGLNSEIKEGEILQQSAQLTMVDTFEKIKEELSNFHGMGYIHKTVEAPEVAVDPTTGEYRGKTGKIIQGEVTGLEKIGEHWVLSMRDKEGNPLRASMGGTRRVSKENIHGKKETLQREQLVLEIARCGEMKGLTVKVPVLGTKDKLANLGGQVVQGVVESLGLQDGQWVVHIVDEHGHKHKGLLSEVRHIQ